MDNKLDEALRRDLCDQYMIDSKDPSCSLYFCPPMTFGHGFYTENFDRTLEIIPGLHHAQFGSIPPPHDPDNAYDRWRAGTCSVTNAWRAALKLAGINNEYGSML